MSELSKRANHPPGSRGFVLRSASPYEATFGAGATAYGNVPVEVEVGEHFDAPRSHATDEEMVRVQVVGSGTMIDVRLIDLHTTREQALAAGGGIEAD